MIKKWGLGFYIGIAVLGLSLFLASQYGIPLSGKNTKSFSFRLKNQKNEWVDSRSMAGSVIVLHFWAAWCPPCLPELGEFLDAAKKLPKDQNNKNIYWVLISQDESWDKANKVLKEHELPAHVVLLIDPDTKISQKFGTYQFPETYVLNSSHELSAKWIGPQSWSEKWGEQALLGIEKLSRLGQLDES